MGEPDSIAKSLGSPEGEQGPGVAVVCNGILGSGRAHGQLDSGSYARPGRARTPDPNAQAVTFPACSLTAVSNASAA